MMSLHLWLILFSRYSSIFKVSSTFWWWVLLVFLFHSFCWVTISKNMIHLHPMKYQVFNTTAGTDHSFTHIILRLETLALINSATDKQILSILPYGSSSSFQRSCSWFTFWTCWSQSWVKLFWTMMTSKESYVSKLSWHLFLRLGGEIH